jgi:hypothetical protein
LTVNGFQDRRIRPLCHLSGAKIGLEMIQQKLFLKINRFHFPYPDFSWIIFLIHPLIMKNLSPPQQNFTIRILQISVVFSVPATTAKQQNITHGC